MPLLFGHDKAVADWVAAQNRSTFAEPYAALGILSREGRLIGGAVFWCFTGKSLSVALAGHAIFRRASLAAILSYVFDQQGCDRLEARPSGKHLRRIVSRLGLVYEGTARSFYGEGRNGYTYSLTRADVPAFKAKWGLTQ